MEGTGQSIEKALAREKKELSKEDQLVLEAKKLIIKGRLSQVNILENLKFYNSSFEFLDEEEVEPTKVFTLHQVKETCTKLRLRFLPSQEYEGEIPMEALFKIENLNKAHSKNLAHFRILSTKDFFSSTTCKDEALLFAQTLYGNQYLIHRWGNKLEGNRRLKYFPLQKLETLLLCLISLSLLLALSLPGKYLSTDTRAGYFSMYRMAAFFHLLILTTGLTIFTLFAFNLNFSESIWDSQVKKKGT